MTSDVGARHAFVAPRGRHGWVRSGLGPRRHASAVRGSPTPHRDGPKVSRSGGRAAVQWRRGRGTWAGRSGGRPAVSGCGEVRRPAPNAGVGGDGDERSRAKTPHPRPLSPEYRGEGRILAAGCFSARDVDRGNQLLGRDRPGRLFRKRRDVSRQARPRAPCDLGSARRVAASPRVERESRCCR